MSGHIEKRGKNKYLIIIEIGRDKQGNRLRYTKMFTGLEREAKKELRKLLDEFDKKGFVKPSSMTVEEYLKWWLEQHRKTKQDLSPVTVDSYRIIIKAYIVPHLGSIKLQDLKPFHIQNFISTLLEQKSPRTVDYAVVILKQALSQAVTPWQLITQNPAENIKRPTYKKNKYHILTPEETQKILSVAKSKNIRDYYFILFALLTGMRRGELCALTWDNVDLKNKVITVKQSIAKLPGQLIIKPPKTEAGIREISISSTTEQILKEIKALQKVVKFKKEKAENKIDNNNFVFCHPNGSPYKPDYITHKFKKIINEAKLENIRFHDLRHTHATLLFAWGERTHDVQLRLGHEKPSTTTDLYGHAVKEHAQELAIRFEEKFNQYLGNQMGN